MSATKTRSTQLGSAKRFSLFAVSLVTIASSVAVVFAQDVFDQRSPTAREPQYQQPIPLDPTRLHVAEPTIRNQVNLNAIAHLQPDSPSPHQVKSRELAHRIHQLRGDANKEERERLLAELEENLDAEFDLRHERQAREIEQTQQRLDAAKAILDQRAELKEKIIARRLNELLGKPDVLDWNPATTSKTFLPVVVDPQRWPPIQHAPSNYRSGPTVQNPPVGLPAGSEIIAGSQQSRRQATPIPGYRTETSVRIDATQRGDVFAIARRLITARSAAFVEQQNLERMQMLAQKGAVTPDQLIAARTKSNQATAEAALAEAELDAFEKRLERESDFATAGVERYQSLQSQAVTRFQAGTAMMDSVLQAEAAVAANKRILAEIEDSKRQLAKALQLIEVNAATVVDDELEASDEDNESPQSREDGDDSDE